MDTPFLVLHVNEIKIINFTIPIRKLFQSVILYLKLT